MYIYVSIVKCISLDWFELAPFGVIVDYPSYTGRDFCKGTLLLSFFFFYVTPQADIVPLYWR